MLLQEISYLLTFIILYCHYSVHAGPKSRDVQMVQDHKATAESLGKVIKLFGRQEILNLKKTSTEKNLRLRRDHDSSSNPCVKEVLITRINLIINETHVVKEHVCFKTTNLGCNPVSGKYLCEKMLSMYRDSAGKTQAYTSGCRCVNP